MLISPTILRTDLHFEPFRPALQGRFLARFHQAAKELVSADQHALERIIKTEVEWSDQTSGNLRQQDMYKAVWLLLRDLIRVGWIPGWNAKTSTFEVSPPAVISRSYSAEEIHEQKAARRSIMAHERHTKLYEAREFIRRMESPAQGLPITVLIADGMRIAGQLQKIVGIEDKTTRHNALRAAVRPYLVLVEENVRCQFTGHLLGDIWRYFRLTWSSPAYNTPGRSMFYLVRDAAQPNHPVIGIASLENAPIFIGVRDKYLGWTAEAFVDSLLVDNQNDNGFLSPSERVRQAFTRLLDQITVAVSEINPEGLCNVVEIDNPTPELVKRLSYFAAQFAEERRAALRRWASHLESGAALEDEEGLERSEFGNISTEAYELLFKKKRAGELARLLGARIEINQLLSRRNFADEWLRWAGTEKGKTAIRNGLLASKNRHVGTSIMELNVCGAIPPYNHLLGGKLTALLMCSPQVVDDYRKRYGNARSEIASQLKGENVVRPAQLVYIGTTSLYTAGASQYNRLKLPAGLLRSDAPIVDFKLLGETLGYGTAHISEATTTALEATSSDDYLQVNHVMGEGVSPKMRIIRSGLDVIFRTGQRSLSDRMAQHSMQRLVYGVWLAENGRAYLRGETNQPRYVWDEALEPQDGTELIADFWRTRWLDSRITFAPALAATSAFQPLSLLVSNALDDKPDVDWAYAFTKSKRDQPTAVSATVESPHPQDSGERKRQLVRDLYRGPSGMAENIPVEDLRYLHASTRLDDVIRQHIASGRSVVLTGNPGDGKTHLLLMLAPELEAMNAVVERDASQVRNDQIVQRWRQALTSSRPYFIAVNESVLFRLATTHRDFAPLQRAWQQVSQAIDYRQIGETHSLPPQTEHLDDVVVLDLSHRNTLSPDLVDAVIMKLTDTSMLSRCSLCPNGGCDLTRNQGFLRAKQVRHRLQLIFERIVRRGVHVTMRDLQGFAAYLLFAERDCTRMLQQSDEATLALPQLPFTGTGKLFDAIRRTFDPALICHPVFDDHIVNNTLSAEDWLQPEMAHGGSLDANALDHFEQRKRSFYSFHRDGEALLQLASDEDNAFAAFMAETNQRNALRSILTMLTAFFSRRPDPNVLPVWQSHRYDHSAQRILYAVQERQRSEFELLRPILAPTMAAAFDLADDYRLLRLRDNHQASLRIDFQLFQLLHRAERGLPVLFLQPDLSRRIWKFLEQLPNGRMKAETEVKAKILDSVTGDLTVVTVDCDTGTYISINEG